MQLDLFVKGIIKLCLKTSDTNLNRNFPADIFFDKIESYRLANPLKIKSSN